MVHARLTRSTTDRMIAGVCGGLGQYFGVDPVIVRLIFVVLAFTTFLTPLIYPVLWLIMPESREPSVTLPPDARYHPLTGEPLPPRSAARNANTPESSGADASAVPSGRNRALGLLLLGVGAIVLLNTIGDVLSRLLGLDLSNILFPLLLVALGMYLLRKS